MRLPRKTHKPIQMVEKTWKDTARALLLKVYLILTVLGAVAGAGFYAGTQLTAHADSAPVVANHPSK